VDLPAPRRPISAIRVLRLSAAHAAEQARQRDARAMQFALAAVPQQFADQCGIGSAAWRVE
jgi:hypothetical protein